MNLFEQLDVEYPSEQTGGANTKRDERQTNRESVAADPLSVFVQIHQLLSFEDSEQVIVRRKQQNCACRESAE